MRPRIGHNSGARENVDAMPASLQEIAELLGCEICFSLVEHFGGTEIKIPQKLKPGHALEILGTMAGPLCHFFADLKIDVPKTILPADKAAEVAALEQSGLCRAEIARRMDITQRHVRRLANRRPPARDDRQYSLFDDEI